MNFIVLCVHLCMTSELMYRASMHTSRWVLWEFTYEVLCVCMLGVNTVNKNARIGTHVARGGQTPWLVGRPAYSDRISDIRSKVQIIVIFRKNFRNDLNQNPDQSPDICPKSSNDRNFPQKIKKDLTRFRRTSDGEVIPGPEQGFYIVGGYFSADLKSSLYHSLNMHFPITRSSMAFLKIKVMLSYALDQLKFWVWRHCEDLPAERPRNRAEGIHPSSPSPPPPQQRGPWRI